MNNSLRNWALGITVLLHAVATIGFYFIHVKHNPKPVWTNLQLSFPEEEQTQLEKPKEQFIPKDYQERNLDQRRYSVAKTNEAVNEAMQELSKGEREQLEQEVNDAVDQMARKESTTGFMDGIDNSPVQGNLSPSMASNSKTQKKSGSKAGTAETGNVHNKATNISYYLKDRSLGAFGLYNPVYLCDEGGVVVINIVVNNTGQVVSATVNENKTETRDNCLRQAAKEAALKSSFNENQNAANKQRGIITYRFNS
jgi:hypothetical protein